MGIAQRDGEAALSFCLRERFCIMGIWPAMPRKVMLNHGSGIRSRRAVFGWSFAIFNGIVAALGPIVVIVLAGVRYRQLDWRLFALAIAYAAFILWLGVYAFSS